MICIYIPEKGESSTLRASQRTGHGLWHGPPRRWSLSCCQPFPTRSLMKADSNVGRWQESQGDGPALQEAISQVRLWAMSHPPFYPGNTVVLGTLLRWKWWCKCPAEAMKVSAASVTSAPNAAYTNKGAKGWWTSVCTCRILVLWHHWSLPCWQDNFDRQGLHARFLVAECCCFNKMISCCFVVAPHFPKSNLETFHDIFIQPLFWKQLQSNQESFC